MSHLVGNPEDWFSRVAIQLFLHLEHFPVRLNLCLLKGLFPYGIDRITHFDRTKNVNASVNTKCGRFFKIWTILHSVTPVPERSHTVANIKLKKAGNRLDARVMH